MAAEKAEAEEGSTVIGTDGRKGRKDEDGGKCIYGKDNTKRYYSTTRTILGHRNGWRQKRQKKRRTVL